MTANPRFLLLLPAVAALAGCPYGGVHNEVTACEPFKDMELSGSEDAGAYISVIHHIAQVIYDEARTEGSDIPWPLKNAAATVWVTGGADDLFDDRALVVCSGTDCDWTTDPSRFVRSLKTSTDDNGLLSFAVATGPYAGGAVMIEFEHATCVISVIDVRL